MEMRDNGGRKMIREARKSDAKKIAELIYIIWNDMELPLVQNNDTKTVLEVIEQSITDSQYRNHYSHIHVYEVDGEVAGFVNCYRGSDEQLLEDNWKNIDFESAFELEGTPLPEREAEDEDLYLESIAVFSKFRGQGIASKLIDYTSTIARNKDENTVALICEDNNIGAFSLYKKIGFEPRYEKVINGHNYYYMTRTI